MFRSLLPTVARWRSLEGEGLEHLNITPAGNTFNATGVIIGERGDVPYGVRYSIDCASDWRVFHFLIETTSGLMLELKSDGNGHWTTMAGDALPEFDGCMDIDLAGTPFTNSLPIRRLLGLTPESGTVQLSTCFMYRSIVSARCETANDIPVLRKASFTVTLPLIARSPLNCLSMKTGLSLITQPCSSACLSERRKPAGRRKKPREKYHEFPYPR